ncbi:MAG: helix-hairpin-helix domain-containing protein [Pseudomonadota bacterium]
MLKHFMFLLSPALRQAKALATAFAMAIPVALAVPIALGSAVLTQPVYAEEAVVAAASTTVNINRADASTLAASLAGVGQSRAEAIVRYREEFGPFFTAEDLLQVRGIGPSVLEKNRDRIALE